MSSPPLEELELELLDELLDSDELELLELEPAVELVEPGDELDGLVGLAPPQAASAPTPARAAPPESRIRKSRRSFRVTSSGRSRSSATEGLLGLP